MYNYEHIDKFFQTQTLVIWRPGHMGGFLMNLLEADKPNYSLMNQQQKMTRIENLEWCHSDYFVNYFNISIVPDLEREFIRLEDLSTNQYGNEIGKKKIAYLIAVVNHLHESRLTFGNRYHVLLDVFRNIKTADDIEQYISQPINNNNFNYVKSHTSWKIIKDKDFHSIPWKEKIYCYFPPNKDWLKFVLHFYKLSYYFNVISTPPWHFEEPFNNEITSLINNSPLHLDTLYPEYEIYPFIPKEELKHVDMYKLLFEDDYNNLGIDITETHKKLIDIARQDTIDILNFFGLDHEMNLSKNDDLSKHPAFKKFRKLVIANYMNK